MKFSWKGRELHGLRLKYTQVNFWVHQFKLARKSVLKHELGCTWVENAQSALCRQVLRSRACEVEENLSAKCTECSFNPNVNEEVAKYPDAELARRGVLGLPPSWHWDESVEVLPLFWSTSYEYPVLAGSLEWSQVTQCWACKARGSWTGVGEVLEAPWPQTVKKPSWLGFLAYRQNKKGHTWFVPSSCVNSNNKNGKNRWSNVIGIQVLTKNSIEGIKNK